MSVNRFVCRREGEATDNGGVQMGVQEFGALGSKTWWMGIHAYSG